MEILIKQHIIGVLLGGRQKRKLYKSRSFNFSTGLKFLFKTPMYVLSNNNSVHFLASLIIRFPYYSSHRSQPIKMTPGYNRFLSFLKICQKASISNEVEGFSFH